MVKNKKIKQRYFALDRIRALALFNMIIYHTIWDLVYLFGFDWKWYQSPIAYIWQQAICWTFIFLSGFCQSFGHKTLKRGLLVFFLGILISIATIFTMPQAQVIFGILTLLGSCMLITFPLERILKKCCVLLGLIISSTMFILTKNINNGYLGFENWNFLKLPDILYCNLGTAFFGFPSPDFYSTDYFSLFPWYFLFLSGYFFKYFLSSKGAMKYLEPSRIKILEWIGAHSLEIYIIHQPFVYLLLTIFLRQKI